MGKIQCKALKIIFNSNESFEYLLLNRNEVSIHQKHLRQLTTEIYKSLIDLNLEVINPLFMIIEIPYNIRNGLILIYHRHELQVMAQI